MELIDYFVDGGKRIGYVYHQATGVPDLAIFVESNLSRRVTFPKSFAFADLNYALYLGRSERSSQLLEATTSEVPIVGRRAVSILPFANTSLTLVGTPIEPLGGTLSRRLALIVALLGALLTVEAALGRRSVAGGTAPGAVRAALEDFKVRLSHLEEHL